MKKLCLLLTGMWFFATLPIFAQTGKITLQVDWVPNGILAQNVPMAVYVDNSLVFYLSWKESKEITLPSGSHRLSIQMTRGSFRQPDPILFNANSGRVVFRATPISGWSANTIDIVQVTPSSSTNTLNVINVNINTLFNEIENNGARAQQIYGGKTIRTTGTVQGTDSNNIFLIGNEWYPLLFVNLIPSERSKLINLQKGQTITVRGVFRVDVNLGRVERAVIE